MIDFEKFDKFSQNLDEMAAAVPAGSFVKCPVTNDSAEYEYGRWSGDYIQQQLKSLADSKFDPSVNGYYIMKVDKSAQRFIEGTVLYMNGFKQSFVGKKVRFKYPDAIKPGKELKIFQNNQSDIDEIVGKNTGNGKVVYIDGSEPYLMSHDGKPVTGLHEGEYQATSLNFKLSADEEEPVFVFYMNRHPDKNPGFSIKLSDIGKLLTKLSNEQKVTISEWFTKQLGIKVEYGTNRWDTEKFVIHYWRIAVEKGNWATSGSYEPFVSRSQAEKFAELLKGEKTSICSHDFKFTTGTTTMSLDELLVFANNNGVKAKMKDVLTVARGSVAGKGFGL